MYTITIYSPDDKQEQANVMEGDRGQRIATVAFLMDAMEAGAWLKIEKFNQNILDTGDGEHDPVELPQRKDPDYIWYFTFGVGSFLVHYNTEYGIDTERARAQKGISLLNKCVEVHASSAQRARELMQAKFGNDYSSQYAHSMFQERLLKGYQVLTIIREDMS